MMRVYLANKMTGIPYHNYPWFDEAAAYLRALGHDVVSPAELDSPSYRAAALASENGEMPDVGESWGDILAKDVKLLADGGIEAVVVGDKWRESPGARLETFIAHNLGIPVLRYPSLTPVYDGDLLEAWLGYIPDYAEMT